MLRRKIKLSFYSIYEKWDYKMVIESVEQRLYSKNVKKKYYRDVLIKYYIFLDSVIFLAF